MEKNRIPLGFKIKKPVLAFGSQNKNTLCFLKDENAFLSAEHLDLSDPQDFFSFRQDAGRFIKKNPKVFACDLHPEYQSTKFARSLRLKTCNLQLIQHHHAHTASCMAENGLVNQKVIGVAFDGTGLGSDGTLWGAEFLVCDYKSFERMAHLKNIALIGGEKAVREPWRLAAAWLYQAYGDKFLGLKVDFTKEIKPEIWSGLKKMQAARFNAPLSSSMGRLFDACASIILARHYANREAELAQELEKIAGHFRAPVSRYDFKITKVDAGYSLDPRPLFQAVISDLKKRLPKEEVAYNFHFSIARLIRKICLSLRRETGINKIALSGGVFQNKLLLRLSLDLLYKEGFQVYTHRKLYCNDSSLSLGQAVIAGFSQ